MGGLRVRELTLDRARIVQLALRLLEQLLGDPDGAPDRRERQRQEARDQAHACTPGSSVANATGGSGPVASKRSCAERSAASSASTSSKDRSAPRSTRNEPLKTTS